MKPLIHLPLLLALFIPTSAAFAEAASQNLGRVWGSYYAGLALYEGCSKAFPGNKSRYDQVFGDWLERNHRVAEKTIGIFYEDLKNMVESEQELAEVDRLMQQLMQQFETGARAEVDRIIGESSQGYCDSMAERLGSGKAELTDLYGSELERFGILDQ